MSTLTKNHAQIKSTNKTRLLALSGLFAAMIYVVTAYIHIPTGVGYTHAGDGLIYLAASLLPTPYAVASAAIGGALADGLSGFAVWLPATIIVKAITALFFSRRTEKIICPRNLVAIIPSLVLCIVFYSVYEGLFIADGISRAAFAVAFAQAPAYCVQVGISSILYILLGLALDKAKLKRLI